MIISITDSPPAIYCDHERNKLLASNAYGDQVYQPPKLATTQPVTLSWRERIKEQVSEIYGRTSQANWDGYSGSATTEENFRFALKFVDTLPEGIEEPDVSVDPDGQFSFEWRTSGQPRIFSISIDKNLLTYAGILSPQKKEQGENVFFDSLPKDLSSLLSEYFRKAG